MESFVPLNGSAGNSAPVTGGRRHKLKVVTRKHAKKILKKHGLKLRGGADADTKPVAVPSSMMDKTDADNAPDAVTGGRRHRGGKTRRHHKRSLFGLRY